MGFINVVDGDFPKQKAIFISKTGMLKKTAIAIRPEGRLSSRYNVRNAVKKIEMVQPDKKVPTVKIVLFDDRVIVFKIGNRDLSELNEAIHAGPDGSGEMFVKAFQKGTSEKYLLLFLACLGLIFVYPSFFGPSSGSPPADNTPPQAQSALTLDAAKTAALASTLCEERIRRDARSPRSLDFPWGQRADVLDGENILLTSYFDGQNAFGAEIRTYYVCQITLTGSDPSSIHDWSLKEIVYQ